jgi:hypothetical protein
MGAYLFAKAECAGTTISTTVPPAGPPRTE